MNRATIDHLFREGITQLKLLANGATLAYDPDHSTAPGGDDQDSLLP